MDARKKILIVDDEQINLEFFDVMLSKLGFTVEKAENGVEALEKVRHFFPDLIILDNIMPKMSGWEVTKTLKNSPDFADYKDVPIIMFSAMDDVKDKVEGFELGVDDYITKPYNFSEVLARIKAVLRNRELFAQIAARESRLALAEELNTELYGIVSTLAAGAAELENASSLLDGEALSRDHKEFKKLVELIRAKSTETKKRMAELDARVARAGVERDRIKKMEIELKALEHQFRKGFHQE